MDTNYINQLKQILKTGPLTQRELAQRLGVSFAALSRWLHGRAVPHPRRVQAIERFYRERVGYGALDEKEMSRIVRGADVFKRRRLWDWIAGNQALRDELLLEHTYNSTAIEGTTFTKRQTEVVIFSKTLLPDKSLIEHLEVTHHAAVLRGIFQKKYTGPVSEKLIRTLHRDLMQGIREDAGSYSKYQRVVRGIDVALTHPKGIPEEMGRLIKRWRSRPSRKTAREIASFHVQFELIHPFGDGNGRVGRLITAFQCLQEGYPPVVIENARKAEYYEVLEYAQKKSEGPFIRFFVDEMKATDKMLQKYR